MSSDRQSIYEIHDQRFRHLISRAVPGWRSSMAAAAGRKGRSGLPIANCLLWSDIPNERMLRYVPDGEVSVFRPPPTSPMAIPATGRAGWSPASMARAGSLRTEVDGTITVLADSYQGKRLNSPNDVVVKSDGSIWFTDPTYGIMSDYEGYKGQSGTADPQCLPHRSAERRNHCRHR